MLSLERHIGSNHNVDRTFDHMVIHWVLLSPLVRCHRELIDGCSTMGDEKQWADVASIRSVYTFLMVSSDGNLFLDPRNKILGSLLTNTHYYWIISILQMSVHGGGLHSRGWESRNHDQLSLLIMLLCLKRANNFGPKRAFFHHVLCRSY